MEATKLNSDQIAPKGAVRSGFIWMLFRPPTSNVVNCRWRGWGGGGGEGKSINFVYIVLFCMYYVPISWPEEHDVLNHLLNFLMNGKQEMLIKRCTCFRCLKQEQLWS